MATVKLLKPTAITNEHGGLVMRTYYDLGHSELAFVTMANISGNVSTFISTGAKPDIVYPAGIQGFTSIVVSEDISATEENMRKQHQLALLTAVAQIENALRHFSKWFPTDLTKSPYDLEHPEELQCIMCGGSGGWPGGETGWAVCKPCNGTGLA
jgi:hypothetical protein